MVRSSAFTACVVLTLSSVFAACGSSTGGPSPGSPGSIPDAGVDAMPTTSEAGSPDAGSTPDAALPPPLSPALGGGMPLTCAPSDGQPATGKFPACTFVDSQACTSDGECGCGCSCQCGVCNCDAAGLVSSCTPGAASPGACCAGDSDCGPSCYGLSCVNSRCVLGGSGSPSPWTGVWKGTFDWPTALYGGTCGDGGVSATGSTGAVSGKFSVVVTGEGDRLTFFFVSQQGAGQPLCALPFVASVDTATLVPGSTCVTAGGANLCTLSGPADTALETFLGGTAKLEGGTLSIATEDVVALPSEPGPECGVVPAGEVQVNVESLSATLERADAGP